MHRSMHRTPTEAENGGVSVGTQQFGVEFFIRFF